MSDTFLGSMIVTVVGDSFACSHGLCGLRGEDRCSSNKHANSICAHIAVSPLKERNMVYNERVCQGESI